MQTIKTDAANMNPRAIFILDQIKNYSKKVPRWSELTIRQCIAWRYSSPKGYEFPRNLLYFILCEISILYVISLNPGKRKKRPDAG
jgi:hypothetical protein